MAASPRLNPAGPAPDTARGVLVRAAQPLTGALWAHLFTRYPRRECGILARFGWRPTPRGIVLTVQALLEPRDGDLDLRADHVVMREPYLLRAAVEAEMHPFALGVIHSHPQGATVGPSPVDDDMDEYLRTYFGSFAPGRPYVSLIASRSAGGQLALSGRVWWDERWQHVTRWAVDGLAGLRDGFTPPRLPAWREGLSARLASGFGLEAAARLHAAAVAVIGASGTGSPALEVLVRAGVGELIVIDPDVFAASNLERVHGSVFEDVRNEPPKVHIQARHLCAINPHLRLKTLVGRLPQADVIDQVVWADVVLGCTDSQSARVALSDLSKRFLVPVLDVGVALGASRGQIIAQVVQLARLAPSDPCVYCREMVDPVRVTEELTSAEQQQHRRAAALRAIESGGTPDAYWRGPAQLNTVGYLTTIGGAAAAGYAIGWTSGRFEPPFELLQLDVAQPEWGMAERGARQVAGCACAGLYGGADQAEENALIEPPSHWPPCLELTT